MDPKSVVDLLGRTALFGSLAEQDRTAIVARMRRIQFQPDQMIFSRGDPGRDIYLVLEGRIRLSVLSTEGRELSFDHAGPGPGANNHNSCCWIIDLDYKEMAARERELGA